MEEWARELHRKGAAERSQVRRHAVLRCKSWCDEVAWGRAVGDGMIEQASHVARAVTVCARISLRRRSVRRKAAQSHVCAHCHAYRSKTEK